jgi:hypothetical protein
MRQAPPSIAACSSHVTMSSDIDMMRFSDDDDAPMVFAAGADVSSRAPAVAQRAVRSPGIRGISSSVLGTAGTVAKEHTVVGSKRLSTAVVSASDALRHAMPSGHKLAAGAAASVASEVAADEQADVLEIDDLDSLFAL